MVAVWLVIALLAGWVYTQLIRRIYFEWTEVLPWSIPNSFRADCKVCVVIAVRNEADNIARCLKSLLQQSYPKDLLEILVVDDHSTDQTTSIIKRFDSRLIRLIRLADFNDRAGKKAAIELGICSTDAELILTTDGDCWHETDWVLTMVSYLKCNTLQYITGPVCIEAQSKRIEYLQSLEMLGMNALTAFGMRTKEVLLSNGANSCFKRSLFKDLRGFEGIDDIASGDDVLFLRKVNEKYPDQIGYCKSNAAIVKTTAMGNFGELLAQRIRWASKFDRLGGSRIKRIMAGVLIYNFLIAAGLLVAIFLGNYYWFAFAALVFFKFRIDYWFVRQLAREFGRRHWMKYFVTAFVLYPFVILCVGILSIFGSRYHWKQRKVK